MAEGLVRAAENPRRTVLVTKVVASNSLLEPVVLPRYVPRLLALDRPAEVKLFSI
jgi:hypothetical protein